MTAQHSDRSVVDVAIVGAGIAGLSLAFELARRSTLRITVIAPAQHLSGTATPAAQGISAIKGLLVARDHLFHAKLSAHRFLRTWLPEVSAAAGLPIPQNHDGVGELCPDLASYQRVAGRVFQRRFQGAFGVMAGKFGEAGIHGLLYPGDFWFDPGGLLDALEIGIHHTGGTRTRRIHASVVSISAGDAACLRLDDGSSLTARQVVLANGWQAPALLGHLSGAASWVSRPAWKKVPGKTIEWKSSQPLISPVFAPASRPVSSFVRGTRSITLTPAGSLVAGPLNNEEDGALGEQESDLLSSIALEAALFLPLPGEDLSALQLAVSRWGIRLRCRDRAPVCGPLDHSSGRGVWLFTGFYKNGLQLAPWLAPRLADALAARAMDAIPPAFSTGRLLL